jgi:lysophospholipase L1-like esterase
MSGVRVLLLGLLSVLGTVLALEGGARLRGAGPPGLFPAEFIAGRAFVEPDAALGFRLVPGFSDGLYGVNAAGFRGGPLPQDIAERFTILCAGDSTTFGWLVPQGGDLPAQLGRLLADRDERITVVNGGVPSFTSEQVLRKLRRDLPRLRPEIVIVTMPWNDLWYSALESWEPDVLVPRVAHRWQSLLLQRSALFRALAQVPRVELRRNQTAAGARTAFAANMAAAAVAVREAGATPVFQMPPFSPGRVPAAGIRFLPTGLQWDKPFLLTAAQQYADAFRAAATARAVLVQETPLFMAAAALTDLFVDEIHPTAGGYTRMARDLAEALAAERLLPAAGSR